MYDQPFAAVLIVAAVVVWLTVAVARAVRVARRRLHAAPWPDRDEAMRRHPAGGGR